MGFAASTMYYDSFELLGMDLGSGAWHPSLLLCNDGG